MVNHKTEKYLRILLLLAKGCTGMSRAMVMKRVKDTTPTGHQPDPWTLDEFLFTNQRSLYCPKRKRRHILDRHCRLVCTSNGDVDLEQWDLLLVANLLLDVCTLPLNIKVHLKTLKRIRNELCHSYDAELSDKKYYEYLGQLKAIVKQCLIWIADSALTSKMNTLIEEIDGGSLAESGEILRNNCMGQLQIKENDESSQRIITQILIQDYTLMETRACDQLELKPSQNIDEVGCLNESTLVNPEPVAQKLHNSKGSVDETGQWLWLFVYLFDILRSLFKAMKQIPYGTKNQNVGEIPTSRGRSSELKKPFNDSLTQSEHNALNVHMQSVGALISDKHIGTVFVVGKKYVMTAWHVVRDIIQDPIYGVNLSNMDCAFIKFDENPFQSCQQYYVEREPVFVDELLDVAVLEIKCPFNLPQSVLLCKNDIYNTSVNVISICGFGQSGSHKKHIEHGCQMFKPNSTKVRDAIAHLQTKHNTSERTVADYYKCAIAGNGKDIRLVDLSYRGYDKESKLLFHCCMGHGASGSPLVTPKLIPGKVYAVGVMTNGIPDFYYDLPKLVQDGVPPEYLFETGSKMSYVYKSILQKNKNLAHELFE